MKIIITENQLRKVQFKYLDYLFGDIQEVSYIDFPESIFWKKNNQIVLELDESGNMRVPYDIWKDFSNMFSSNDDETQQVMKEWLEQRLNLKGITPLDTITFSPDWLEQR